MEDVVQCQSSALLRPQTRLELVLLSGHFPLTMNGTATFVGY